jgi:tetratricopeptide (TPR) repeat protein
MKKMRNVDARQYTEAMILKRKGDAYAQVGLSKESASSDIQYLKLQSDDAVAATNLAYVLLDLDDIATAKKYLQFSEKLEQNSVDNTLGLIAVSYLLNERSELKRYKQKLKKIRPDLPSSGQALDLLIQEGYYYSGKFKLVLSKAFDEQQ